VLIACSNPLRKLVGVHNCRSGCQVLETLHKCREFASASTIVLPIAKEKGNHSIGFRINKAKSGVRILVLEEWIDVDHSPTIRLGARWAIRWDRGSQTPEITPQLLQTGHEVLVSQQGATVVHQGGFGNAWPSLHDKIKVGKNTKPPADSPVTKSSVTAGKVGTSFCMIRLRFTRP